MVPKPLHPPLRGPRTSRSTPLRGDGRLAALDIAPGCRQQHRPELQGRTLERVRDIVKERL